MRYLVIVFPALLLAGSASAQILDKGRYLAGVTELTYDMIFAQDDEKDTKSCTIRADDIETTVKFILGQSRVHVMPGHDWRERHREAMDELQRKVDAKKLVFGSPEYDQEWKALTRTPPDLWIIADISPTSTGCFAHLDIHLSADVEPTKITFTGQRWSGWIELWSEPYFAKAPKGDLTNVVSHAVEAALKKFVVDWNEANSPSTRSTQ